jgi:hypothetical protein
MNGRDKRTAARQLPFHQLAARRVKHAPAVRLFAQGIGLMRLFHEPSQGKWLKKRFKRCFQA